MKRLLLLVITSIFLFSCGEKRADSVVLSGFYDIPGDVKEAALSGYYTDGTLSEVKRLRKSLGATDLLLSLDRKIFIKGAVLKKLSEKIDGDRAEVEVMVEEHPSINMKGLKLKIRFRNEKGRWKIDREDELSRL